MTAQHFAGPWKVGHHAMEVVARGERGSDVKVCDIRGWGYLTGKGAGALGLSNEEGIAIQTANARLIAAAPDLLKALRGMMRWVDEPADADDTLGQARELEFVKAAQAAIAKAEGR